MRGSKGGPPGIGSAEDWAPAGVSRVVEEEAANTGSAGGLSPATKPGGVEGGAGGWAPAGGSSVEKTVKVSGVLISSVLAGSTCSDTPASTRGAVEVAGSIPPQKALVSSGAGAVTL